jgi:hypothetical protein
MTMIRACACNIPGGAADGRATGQAVMLAGAHPDLLFQITVAATDSGCTGLAAIDHLACRTWPVLSAQHRDTRT